MAVFRIDKTRDYTVMANHHLRNKALSLKAKGLLSLMLSLPEDWDYTTKGLSMICKDGVDSICSTVKELDIQHSKLSAAQWLLRQDVPLCGVPQQQEFYPPSPAPRRQRGHLNLL